jgi:hypothetical protein
MNALLALALLAIGISTVAVQSAMAFNRVIVEHPYHGRYYRHYHHRPHRTVIIERR